MAVKYESQESASQGATGPDRDHESIARARAKVSYTRSRGLCSDEH